MLNRYLRQPAQLDLKEKMLIIGGPRQVGKTTFALSFLNPSEKTHPAYYNWDIERRRKEVLNAEFPTGQALIVLDEIHKYSRWRNLVKGFYDESYPRRNFLITGSARLDHYRKGGDSLLGRYHYQRLHPFSLLELNPEPSMDDISALLMSGGFPEPLLKGSERFARRWRSERATRVVREDLRDLEHVKDISLIELLLDALPARVGSPLSVRSLQEDLKVAHESVSRWLELLENVYLTYRILPYGSPKIRAVRKEQKLYFWDWAAVEDKGARFENMLASHLLKYCHYLEDTEGFKMELRFIRDKERREVDFVVIKDKKPVFAVECKTGEKSPAKHLRYFADRTPIPLFYQVHLGTRDYESADGRIRVLPFASFLKAIMAP